MSRALFVCDKTNLVIMATDFQGISFACCKNIPEVTKAIDSYMKQVFAYGTDWFVIQTAVQQDPDCVLARVLCSDFHIAREDIQTALEHLRTARSLVQAKPGVYFARDLLYLEAWESWLGGNLTESYSKLAEIVASHPNDLFAVKRAQLIAFCMGSLELQLTIVDSEPVRKACARRPYYQGMLGFALEQNGRLLDAEAAGRLGSEILPSDPWSHHALAHSLYFQGKLQEGIEWLNTRTGTWEDCMSFMRTHNWFHMALFYLDKHDISRVMDIFHRYLWFAKEDHSILPVVSGPRADFSHLRFAKQV